MWWENKNTFENKKIEWLIFFSFNVRNFEIPNYRSFYIRLFQILTPTFPSRFLRAQRRSCYTSRSTTFDPPHVFPTHVNHSYDWIIFSFDQPNCVRSRCIGKTCGESNVVDNDVYQRPCTRKNRELKELYRTSSAEDCLCWIGAVADRIALQRRAATYPSFI